MRSSGSNKIWICDAGKGDQAMITFSIDRNPAVHDESGRPWYDTKAGVAEAAKTLKEFKNLTSERYAAGYDRSERLNEFYVLGRYYLDTCGNCGKAHGVVPKEIMPAIPDALTPAEFHEYAQQQTGKDMSVSFGMDGGGNIPLPGLLCSHCKKPWEDANFYDTVVLHSTEVYSLVEFIGEPLATVKFVYGKRNDAIYRTQPDIIIRNNRYIDLSPKYPKPKHNWEKGAVKNEHGWLSAKDGIDDTYVIEEGDEIFLNVWRYYHSACNQGRLLQETGSKFQSVFAKAGFKMISMMNLPNEYCPCDFCAPWFNVITEFGTIKVGWRKRVINIDWRGLDAKYQTHNIFGLFDKENVTKDSNSIHAWGWEKTEDYLRRIHQHLST